MSVVIGFLGLTASTPLLTVPSGKKYKILTLSLSNRTSVARTCAMYVSPSPGAAPVGNSGCFIPDITINGLQAYREPNGEGMMLAAGDALYGEASVASVIAYQISYAELNA
jgi:hypothetical protein